MSVDAEVAVVGGGVAGLTAALFSARNGRSTVLYDGLIGGQLLNVGKIEAFPGVDGTIAGYEVCPMLEEQVTDAGADIRMATVDALAERDGAWLVSADDGDLLARTVILATGCRFRELPAEGAAELSGRGISHCATCDGPLYAGRVVGVVGGGDSALQEALELADVAERVVVIHRGDRFRAQRTYRERVLAHPAIEVRYGAVVEEVLGDDAVAGVRLREVEAGTTGSVDLSALFVYIGLEPQTELVRDHGVLDGPGGVATDPRLATSRPGLFAAGTVRSGAEGQAATAVGEGAAAAMAAHRYLTCKEQE